MGYKGVEWKIDGLPAGPYCEMSTIGLPRTNVIQRAEMNRVFLVIPAHDNAHSNEARRVNRTSRRG